MLRPKDVVELLGEMEAGNAGTQPCRKISLWVHEWRREDYLLGLFKP